MSEMEPVTEETNNKPSAYISARHRQDAVMASGKSSGSDMVAGICAIVTLLIYVVMLVMLYSDFKILNVA